MIASTSEVLKRTEKTNNCIPLKKRRIDYVQHEEKTAPYFHLITKSLIPELPENLHAYEPLDLSIPAKNKAVVTPPSVAKIDPPSYPLCNQPRITCTVSPFEETTKSPPWFHQNEILPQCYYSITPANFPSFLEPFSIGFEIAQNNWHHSTQQTKNIHPKICTKPYPDPTLYWNSLRTINKHTDAVMEARRTHFHQYSNEITQEPRNAININRCKRWDSSISSPFKKSATSSDDTPIQENFCCNKITQKNYTCRDCGKMYYSLGALKMHIRTHELPCKCIICGKEFSRRWLLQGHIRTHTGEKPHACNMCPRAFADRSNLRAHMDTHSKWKKYQCHHCPKSFSRVSLLARHLEQSCTY